MSACHHSALPRARSRIACSRARDRSTVLVEGLTQIGRISVQGVNGTVGAAGNVLVVAKNLGKEPVPGRPRAAWQSAGVKPPESSANSLSLLAWLSAGSTVAVSDVATGVTTETHAAAIAVPRNTLSD